MRLPKTASTLPAGPGITFVVELHRQTYDSMSLASMSSSSHGSICFLSSLKSNCNEARMKDKDVDCESENEQVFKVKIRNK